MEDDDENKFKSNSISACIIMKTFFLFDLTFSLLSSLSSDPLFSTIISFYTLILLYFPHHLLRIFLSPVLILTGILLLSLLRLGAIQKSTTQIENHESDFNQNKDVQENDEIFQENENFLDNNDGEKFTALPERGQMWVGLESDKGSKSEVGFDPNPYFEDSFVEWDVRAPLEVIFEEYEGEEQDPNTDPETREMGIERYTSMSLSYPDSDSDSSLDEDFHGTGTWLSPENMFFRLVEEEREELIEISLDKNKRDMGFHVEEENLIEIDIFPARNDEFCREILD